MLCSIDRENRNKPQDVVVHRRPTRNALISIDKGVRNDLTARVEFLGRFRGLVFTPVLKRSTPPNKHAGVSYVLTEKRDVENKPCPWHDSKRCDRIVSRHQAEGIGQFARPCTCDQTKERRKCQPLPVRQPCTLQHPLHMVKTRCDSC